MTLSLIIPSFKRPQQVSALLASIDEQKMSHKDFEVLVIANLACPETRSICSEFRSQGLQVQYHDTGRVGVNFARNLGLEKARGNLLVFLDDDCRLPDPFWLDRVSENFRMNSNVDGMGGFYQIMGTPNFWGLIYHIKLRSWQLYYRSNEAAYRLLGGCMIFRREKISDLRFNDQIVFGGAETDFILQSLSRGLKLSLDENLSVLHSFQISLLSFLSKVKRQGSYHWKSQSFEKSVMRDFRSTRSFNEIQNQVIEDLGISGLLKNMIPIGLWAHKWAFHWPRNRS